MKVLAIGNAIKPITDELRAQLMPKEVPATLKHYLEGVIEQMFFRQDKPGVVFLMNVDSIENAKAITDKMPLVEAGVLQYEYQQLGPLKPLGLLIQGK